MSELNFSLDGQPLGFENAFGYGGRVDLRLSQDVNGEILVALKSNGTVYALSELVGTDVPEPSTWALVAASLLLLRLNGRRRASITTA